MLKNSLILIIVSIFLAVTHVYLIPLWIDQGSLHENMKQHIFLCLFSVLIYISTYMASKRIPTQAGFVFIGLLMGKMIAAAYYVYIRGWLDENADDPKKYIFFMYYVVYLVVLVVPIARLLNNVSDKDL